MPVLTERQKQFLQNPYTGVVVTLREDGSPHATVVWVDVDDDGVVSFNTETGRAKPRHLERDARLSLLVVDPANSYRWLAIDGVGEMTFEGAAEQIDRLSEKYTGVTPYRNHPKTERRVTVRIRATRIEGYGDLRR